VRLLRAGRLAPRAGVALGCRGAVPNHGASRSAAGIGAAISNAADNTTRLTLDPIALCAFYRFNSLHQNEMHPFISAMVDALAEAGLRAKHCRSVSCQATPCGSGRTRMAFWYYTNMVSHY
jgi:hypothetical protein